ncbi:MAG: serine/threonine-protein kinase [Myxococcota bacterium]
MGAPIGEVIGGYRLDRLIGAGSTSHVYLGYHARLGRPAAIKVLHATLVDNPQVVQRMLTEARVVNDIRHPNIVDIIDFVDQRRPRRVALVMEHVAGPTVDSLRGGEPIPLHQAIGIAQQLVDAVLAAHRAGVIHRDLKPDNLLLDADPRAPGSAVPQLKVVDFGIAKVAGPSKGHQTATQTMLGTPAYMAPEQISQSPLPSVATDVYAVGEILYELLSGQRAFRSARIGDVVRQKLRGELPNMPLPEVPLRTEVSALIRRCLTFRPDGRPPLTDVVHLLSAMNVERSRNTGEVGEVTIAGADWNMQEGSSDALSEATQLNELNGMFDMSGRRTQALWRPDSSLEEETEGTSSATHFALSVGGVSADGLDQTAPLSSDEHSIPEPQIDDLARHFDLNDRAVMQAETALSTEALSDDEEDSARGTTSGLYEELPTRDVLPSIDRDRRDPDTRPEGIQVSKAISQETVVRPPKEERSGLVPARDGGPPVAADDPLAKRWMSTVIKPRPRDRKSQDNGGAPAGWSETFDRALKARGKGEATPPGERPGVRAAVKNRSVVEGPRSIAPGRERSPHPVSENSGLVHESGQRAAPSRYEPPSTRRGLPSWVGGVMFVIAVLLLTVGLMLFVRPSRTERTVRPSVVPAAQMSVVVRSQPGEAFVEDAETGGFLGKTPVSVSVPPGEVRRVRVFKAGYAARVVELTSEAPSTWVPLIEE